MEGFDLILIQTQNLIADWFIRDLHSRSWSLEWLKYYTTRNSWATEYSSSETVGLHDIPREGKGVGGEVVREGWMAEGREEGVPGRIK